MHLEDVVYIHPVVCLLVQRVCGEGISGCEEVAVDFLVRDSAEVGGEGVCWGWNVSADKLSVCGEGEEVKERGRAYRQRERHRPSGGDMSERDFDP